jgi:glycerate dehydrogenase
MEKPKIMILDGYTLNTGDLSWDAFREIGEVTLHDHTPEDQVLARCQGFGVVITNKTEISRSLIEALPGLRYVGVLATGYNIVDVQAAREHGVIVTNIPTYGTLSVAQFVFAHILEWCHHVQYHSDAVHDGEWTRARDFSFWKYPLIELAGKTIGIVGFGRIGRKVAEIAAAFGMRVLACDISAGLPQGAAEPQWTPLDQLLAESDFVSLHCPLTPETRGFINKASLDLMKKTAFLVNTSRGGLVVEDDLADALNQNRIAGASLDVLSAEPPPASNPLLSARNCIITPHIAWATREARARLMEIAADNLRQYLRGTPVNVVS